MRITLDIPVVELKRYPQYYLPHLIDKPLDIPLPIKVCPKCKGSEKIKSRGMLWFCESCLTVLFP